jgi:hypothetical protein
MEERLDRFAGDFSAIAIAAGDVICCDVIRGELHNDRVFIPVTVRWTRFSLSIIDVVERQCPD